MRPEVHCTRPCRGRVCHAGGGRLSCAGRAWIVVVATTLIMVCSGLEARAQYYRRNYTHHRRGAYVGGVPSTGGDVARGMGLYAAGLGQMELYAARARAVDAQTVLMWNEYLYQSQQEANRRRQAKALAHKKTLQNAATKARERLLSDPTKGDIETGAALNAVYDQLTEPRVRRAALELSSMPIAWENVHEIPFFYASEALTISLHRLTAEDDSWPELLKGDSFAQERAAFRKAVQAVLDLDEPSNVDPRQIKAVRDAVIRLRTRLDESAPRTDPRTIKARDFLKGLAGVTQLLQSPRADDILTALKSSSGRTVAELLDLMESFNLRFGSAVTDRQKRIYKELYQVLVAQRDALLAKIDRKDSQVLALLNAPSTSEGSPVALFRHEHWDDALGRWVEHAPPGQEK